MKRPQARKRKARTKARTKKQGAAAVAKATRRVRQPGRLRSLKVSEAFRTFVLDQLEELGEVTPRAMFGGVGLYRTGVFFGILARDRLYLKVGDANRREYEQAGMRPFKPYADRAGTMQYYEVPLAVLESPLELAAWARRAIAAASQH